MNEVLRRPARRSHATIKEVAELAGVSQMTVSRVLNRRETVKESTRVKVEEAIRELNYRPNLLARGLAGGNPFLSDSFFTTRRTRISENCLSAPCKLAAMRAITS